ncbi:MAG TPA: PIG-L family deacetylase [Alphaproteobacteria bacterium]|jgi:LmbE family N-acetylglucosaminyl deacetylase|nr:PIG-L family deacetylase [Alphaproteobacteria bacterium]
MCGAAAETSRSNAADIGRAFLARLADPLRPSLDFGGISVVVAHPDDETIGCGAQLSRFAAATVVVVTDGAPVDLADARANGCVTPADYARLRDTELREALSLAGIGDGVVRFGVPDQSAARHLGALAKRLSTVLAERDARIVVTHTYEGGHPDHDAVAFAVHAAVELVRRKGHAVAIVEMPLYYPTGYGWAVQQFTPAPGITECVVTLTAPERELKARMIAAHASQRRTLAMFGVDTERFRCAPAHDFTKAPRDNAVWYHGNSWGLTGDQWLSLARTAARDLNLEPI